MSNFRLDYIGNFKDGTVEQMIEIRKKYIQLESEITKLCVGINDGKSFDQNKRVFEQALAHLEQSQMYIIKALCLMGENEITQE